MHIRGLDGIQKAEGLPDGVKELLMMHVKTLGPGESDHYMVNLDLANVWSTTHHVSEAVKKAATQSDSHTGCKSFSMHCAGEATEHAEGQVSNLIQQAKGDWDHAASQLGHDWNVAADQILACFADTRTNPVDLPVDFTLHFPSLITLDSKDVNALTNALNVVNQINSGNYSPNSGNLGSAALAGAASGAVTGAGYGSNATGTAGAIAGAVKGAGAENTAEQAKQKTSGNSGADSPWSETMTGKIVFGFPELSSTGTVVHVDFFYIPCLPFLVRPRSIGATGSMDVEAAITGNTTVTGQYNKTIPIPPADLHIPIQVWPIVIPPTGVPIAEVDISLFVKGYLQITGKGQVSTTLNLDYSHSTGFDFTCSGKGCTPNHPPRSQLRKTPQPPTLANSTSTNTSSKVNGMVEVQPKIFTGLELNVDVDAIQARVGPEATIEGDVQGDACLATKGAVRTSSSDALLAELGWTPGIRADVLIFNKPIGDGYDHPLEKERILAFQDLLQSQGGSSALTPVVAGKPKLAPGQSGTYNVKMSSCYPYSDPVIYQVTWTGGAARPVGINGCSPGNQPNEEICTSDPKKGFDFSLAWSEASTSDYTITVAAVKDTLDRDFKSSKPFVLPITVSAK
jgi:hypothetical protein